MYERPNLAPEEPPPSKPDFSTNFFKKLGFILGVFVLLMGPLFMIQGVMEERQKFNVEYPQQFKGPGAKEQTIIGPVLTVPYEYQTTEQKTAVPNTTDVAAANVASATVKVINTNVGYIHFFPDSLSVNGTLIPEVRDEGKFKSILYSTALEFKGTFNTSELAKKNITPEQLKWQDAFVAVGVSDLRGVRKETTLTWNGGQYKFSPGTNGLKLFDSGQYASLNGARVANNQQFSFTVLLNGSRELNVFPAGKDNHIVLASSWKQPTFTGGFLPSEKTVDPKGFKSVWDVSYFSRNLPQMWTDKDPDMKNSMAQYMVGVNLATPVEFYRTAIRAVKYGSLFIIMTFITFLMFEMTARVRIHEVQYGLVGLALCLFFLLLIAISEWVPFLWAYVLASVPTIAQVTWYIRAFSWDKSAHLWKAAAGVLSALYVYLYILLELENFSLLVGAIGLFAALSVVFYVTRNIDWYGESDSASDRDNGCDTDCDSELVPEGV